MPAFESDRWTGDAEKILIDHETARHGKSSLLVRLTTAQYSGVGLKYFSDDWRGYSSLQFSVFNPSSASLRIVCRIHDSLHFKNGGKYDIILVSSGEDGHIGALYPNHHSIHNESSDLISMNDSPKPPKNRMSISKKFLLKSKIGVLILVGDMKRKTYSNFLDKEIDITKCPAKLITQLPKSIVLTDIELKEEIV